MEDLPVGNSPAGSSPAGSSLDALRDIHLPDSISWWPPALGYWLVVAVLLVAAVLWFRRYRRFAVRRATQLELSRLATSYQGQKDAHDLAKQVNVLLRLAVLSLQPRQEAASLTGNDWITYVQSCSSEPDFTFSDGVKQLLTQGVYQARVDVDAELLLTECRAWVQSLPPRPAA